MKRVFSLSLLCAVGLSATAFAEEKEDWTDKVKWGGDLRYRHESIDKEGSDERTRHRIRARANMEGKVNDDVKVTLQLATGETGDPVSTNQSLTEDFSKKGVRVDMAYFDFHPEAMPGFKVLGGKMKNPFITPAKSDLIWDGDLTPEGLAFTYETDTDVKWLLNGAGFWITERSADDDSMMMGIQTGLKFKMGEGHLLVGGSHYGYSNMEGFAPFVSPTSGFGNTLKKTTTVTGLTSVTVSKYGFDFKESELFAELGMKWGETPVTLFADYVSNSEADSDDTGYLYGFGIGKVKDPGSWEFKYFFKELEKDAVVGAFADSDFGGGGTDSKGHKVSLEVGLAKSCTLGLSYFMNKAVLANEIDYNRAQVDLMFKI